jgi:hypothetical protein
LESTEILLEFTGKPLLKYAVQKRKWQLVYEGNMFSLSSLWSFTCM